MKKVLLLTSFLMISFLLFSEDQISFYAKKMYTTEQGKVITLEGDVLLQLDSFTLYAQSVQIMGEESRTLRAQNDVKIRRKANNSQELSSNELYYIDDQGELRAWGAVKFVDGAQNITITASSLLFVEQEKSWRFEGNVQMTGEDFSSQSHIAIYYESSQILELHGGVNLIQGEQEFEAEQITYNIETKDAAMEQIKRGTITTKTAS